MVNPTYTRLQATANRLIARYGSSSGASLNEPGTPSGDPFNPTMGAPTQHAVTVVVTMYSKREIDGQRILATDKKVFIAPGDGSMDPQTSWSLTIGAVTYQIITISPMQPGDIVLLWEAQCRRA